MFTPRSLTVNPLKNGSLGANIPLAEIRVVLICKFSLVEHFPFRNIIFRGNDHLCFPSLDRYHIWVGNQCKVALGSGCFCAWDRSLCPRVSLFCPIWSEFTWILSNHLVNDKVRSWGRKLPVFQLRELQEFEGSPPR